MLLHSIKTHGTKPQEGAAKRNAEESDDDTRYGDPEQARRSSRANKWVPPDRMVYTASAVINLLSGKVYAM
jgi:hypothetical protein